MDAKLKRAIEQARADDPMGTKRVEQIARSIMDDVGDVDMHGSIPTKVARAIFENRIPFGEVAVVCDIIRSKRKSRQLDKPGAYFLSSMRRLFRKHDLKW